VEIRNAGDGSGGMLIDVNGRRWQLERELRNRLTSSQLTDADVGVFAEMEGRLNDPAGFARAFRERMEVELRRIGYGWAPLNDLEPCGDMDDLRHGLEYAGVITGCTISCSMLLPSCLACPFALAAVVIDAAGYDATCAQSSVGPPPPPPAGDEDEEEFEDCDPDVAPDGCVCPVAESCP